MKCVKEVCKECPFKRDSLAGYLGEASFDPMAFLGPHLQGGEPLPCHLSIDWEADLGGMRVYTDKSLCFFHNIHESSSSFASSIISL